MTILDRHLAFIEALRDAGLAVSLSEGLDAVRAVTAVGLGERDVLRAAYATTLVKRQQHRPAFDEIFDLFFPAVVGFPAKAGTEPDDAEVTGSGADGAGDGPAELSDFTDRLVAAIAEHDADALTDLAREAVGRFGLIRGRQPGEQRWSAYNVLNRVDPATLVARVLAGLGEQSDSDPSTRRLVQANATAFADAVETDVRRRAAEVRGPAYVARHAVRPSIDQLDFSAARKVDLARMQREVAPLARRLATRLNRRRADRSRGPLDFRRTVRASLSAGGVPIDPYHRPRRPTRSDLVVLCDISGSVAHFANFTLMLVYALREQFDRVRAFTFVDDVHEVTDRFRPGADPQETLAALAASAEHASLWGRTNYGRAFTRFVERYPDALTPRTNLLILGDARSNYSDLALPMLTRMVADSRRAWWLNPEHPRHWDAGDSAAGEYGALVPMVECRNLTQLGEFVRDLV